MEAPWIWGIVLPLGWLKCSCVLKTLSNLQGCLAPKVREMGGCGNGSLRASNNTLLCAARRFPFCRDGESGWMKCDCQHVLGDARHWGKVFWWVAGEGAPGSLCWSICRCAERALFWEGLPRSLPSSLTCCLLHADTYGTSVTHVWKEREWLWMTVSGPQSLLSQPSSSALGMSLNLSKASVKGNWTRSIVFKLYYLEL